MSRQLENLEPKNVFYHFEEISKIPRKSGSEKALSDYMVAFANERNLDVYQDDYFNVIIRKPATPGFEDAPGVIIQGHLDMVCEKNEGTEHDFDTDPIDFVIDGEWLKANGTTLGADNGIALAYALALLDSNEYAHPSLEIVFTTEEEIGLIGAQRMDKTKLKGQYFINLDSEEEGELTVGCAGGLKAVYKLPIVETTNTYKVPVLKKIEIKNLLGGHSGADIHRNRANANRLMGRVLSHMRSDFSLRLVEINGGTKDNVITRECTAIIVMEDEQVGLFNDMFTQVVADIKNENRTADPDITINAMTLTYEDSMRIFSKETTDNIIHTLINAPQGILTMSADLPGMVESSNNVGRCTTEKDDVEFWFAVRSSVRSLKYHVTNQLEWFASQIGAKFIQTAEYPEWPFKPDSNLLRQTARVYEEMFNEKPIVKAIHAGLEPGVFLEVLPHLDAISFGPELQDVHSPDEKMDIASAGRTWKLLVEVLASLK